jgi:hypothetical protein
LWNFHFVVTPLAALVLDRAPAALAWTSIALFAVANTRLGAQIAFAPPSRAALVASTAMALCCLYLLRRQRSMAVPA